MLCCRAHAGGTAEAVEICRVTQVAESRKALRDFVASQPRCVVAMEACASAHYWGQEILKLGHDARLIPPVDVKPIVKRQRNDAADAEASRKAARSVRRCAW